MYHISLIEPNIKSRSGAKKTQKMTSRPSQAQESQVAVQLVANEPAHKNRDEGEEDLNVEGIDMDIDFGDTDSDDTDDLDMDVVEPTEAETCGQLSGTCPNIGKLNKCANLRESREKPYERKIPHKFVYMK